MAAGDLRARVDRDLAVVRVRDHHDLEVRGPHAPLVRVADLEGAVRLAGHVLADLADGLIGQGELLKLLGTVRVGHIGPFFVRLA